MTLVNFAPRPVTRSQNKARSANPFFRNTPLVNIHERGDAYELELAVPGISKDRIKLDIKDNQLIIESVNSEAEDKDSEVKYVRKEYDFGVFKKVFNLNEEVDQKDIDASLINGVLTIRLNKKEEAKAIPPRTIAIK